MSKTTKSRTQSAEAGRGGGDVRSDCWVKVTPTGSGRIEIDLRSKVESMYGDSIRRLVRDEIGALGLTNAKVEITDSGALPFVILARVETAVRRLGLDVGEGFLPDFAAGTQDPTQRDRFRRSRLYLPGNEAKFMHNAGLHRPDGVILDLDLRAVQVAVEIESRQEKQIRGAIVDLLLHPAPKKLLIIVLAHRQTHGTSSGTATYVWGNRVHQGGHPLAGREKCTDE